MVVVLSVLAVWIAGVLRDSPWRIVSANHLEVLVVSCVAANTIAASVLLVPDAADVMVARALVSGSSAVFATAVVVRALGDLWRRFAPTKTFVVNLCYDPVAQPILVRWLQMLIIHEVLLPPAIDAIAEGLLRPSPVRIVTVMHPTASWLCSTMDGIDSQEVASPGDRSSPINIAHVLHCKTSGSEDSQKEAAAAPLEVVREVYQSVRRRTVRPSKAVIRRARTTIASLPKARGSRCELEIVPGDMATQPAIAQAPALGPAVLAGSLPSYPAVTALAAVPPMRFVESGAAAELEHDGAHIAWRVQAMLH